MNPTVARPSRLAFLLAAILTVAGAAGCAGGIVRAAPPKRHETVFRIRFVGPDHTLADCARGSDKALVDIADGSLFFEPDSVLRVRVPDVKAGWHIHLYNRVSGVLCEQVRAVDALNGTLSLSLEKFPNPEYLVVTSASFSARGKLPVAERPGGERAVIPAWTMSFKLHPAAEAEARLAVQPNRYDMKTPVGNAHLIVAPITRGDQLLTLVDTTGAKLGRFFQETYFLWRDGDAYLVPKLTVEVCTAGGAVVWQRAGAWPLAPRMRGASPDAYALRTSRKEFLTFAPPPALTLALATPRPETSARIEASVASPKSDFKLVLSNVVPDDAEAKSSTARVQTAELDAASPKAAVVVDTGSLDATRYPLTSAAAHRYVQPWRTPGGLFMPCPALKQVSLDEADIAGAGDRPSGTSDPKLHKLIIAAASATHYDFVRFLGGTGAGRAQPPAATPPGGEGDDGGGDGGGGGGPGLIPGPDETPDPGPILIPGPGGISGRGSAESDEEDPFPLAPVPGWCVCGYNGAACGNDPAFRPKCKGTCGVGCTCGPSGISGVVDIDMECMGCVRKNLQCACDLHTWMVSDVLNELTNYTNVVDGSGNQCPIAEWDFRSPHMKGDVRCHKRTKIGQATVRFWVGARLVMGKIDIYVTFGPCNQPLPPGGGQPGQPLGGGPGGPGPSNDTGGGCGNFSFRRESDASSGGSSFQPFTSPALTTLLQRYASTFPNDVPQRGGVRAMPTLMMVLPPARPRVSDVYASALRADPAAGGAGLGSLTPETVIFGDAGGARQGAQSPQPPQQPHP